jgi:hypothetical protein
VFVLLSGYCRIERELRKWVNIDLPKVETESLGPPPGPGHLKGAFMLRRPQPVAFSMEYEGRTYSASYYLQGRMITVKTVGGQKSTQLGGMRRKVLAEMLLRELVRVGKADP